MLGIHERRHAAEFLRLSDYLQGERRLARRLGPENLHHAAARHTADAEGVVQADGAGRDGGNGRDGILLAKSHDRALAELLLDLAYGHLDRLQAFAVVAVICCGGHSDSFCLVAGIRWNALHSRSVPGRKSSENL